MEGKHPLATVLLRRRLIGFTLLEARSTHYQHAARHVRSIESRLSAIEDNGQHETHDAYTAALMREHSGKPAFWSLLAA